MHTHIGIKLDSHDAIGGAGARRRESHVYLLTHPMGGVRRDLALESGIF